MKPEIDSAEIVRILYTNYRGETSERRVIPIKIWFGDTPWHGDAQWHLDATDLQKGEIRSFAMKEIISWSAGQ